MWFSLWVKFEIDVVCPSYFIQFVKVQGAHKVCLQLKNINSKADDEISQRGLFYINRYLTKFLLTLKFCVSDKNFTCLTPWRLGGFGNFPKKNSSFRLPYQCPSSSVDCARELFNSSNGSASLVDCTRKKIFAWGCGFFVTDVISEVVLGSFWLMLPGQGPNH